MSSHDPPNLANADEHRRDLALLRQIPSVHELLESQPLSSWASRVPRRWIVDAARSVLQDCRKQLTAASPGSYSCSLKSLADQVAKALQRRQCTRLRPVINATGIVLHTGLGRAPLAPSAVDALTDVAGRYANVEIQLESGRRGRRLNAVSELICELTGAEAATVVNNNAAATMLALASLVEAPGGRRRRVIVSRGELIEIGGSFRMPDIMRASGAKLVEVGTTNKTRPGDYEKAIDAETGALLKVHTSNYQVLGFTESVSIDQLVALGRREQVPVVHDIGSGAMMDFQQFSLDGEPIASKSIAAGADLVLFSGDKLLGGPQAGIVIGKSTWIARIESHPLMRAMRVDKLALTALEATLRLHHDPPRAMRELPVLKLLATPKEELRRRAEKITAQLRSLDQCDIQLVAATAYLGGGSLPTQGTDSVAIRIRAPSIGCTELARRLRTGKTPVVPRVQDKAIWLDLRTVFPEQDAELIGTVQGAVI